MTQVLGAALAALAVIAVPVGFLVILVCAYLVPVNIMRIAQHLRGIRESLDRIAAAAERNGGGGVDEFRELEMARRKRATEQAGSR